MAVAARPFLPPWMMDGLGLGRRRAGDPLPPLSAPPPTPSLTMKLGATPFNGVFFSGAVKGSLLAPPTSDVLGGPPAQPPDALAQASAAAKRARKRAAGYATLLEGQPIDGGLTASAVLKRKTLIGAP